MEQYIIDRVVLLKFEGETIDKSLQNFDSFDSETQERLIENTSYEDWNRLKPIWDSCMDIIEGKSLDSRLKCREAEMIRSLQNSIRFNSSVCYNSVLDFVNWYFENKQYI